MPATLAAFGLSLALASGAFAQGGGGGGGGAGGGAGGAGGAGAGAGAGGAAGGAAGVGGVGGSGAGTGGAAGAAGAGTVSTPFGSGPGGNGVGTAGGAAGSGTVATPFGSFPGGNGAGGSTSTPFGQFNGGGNQTGTAGDFSNVAGFNPYAGTNPGFNGGFNPNFGNTSGPNTNFAFNPYNGYNPLLGNPAGISGYSGSPFGTNALTNNPLNPVGPNGLGAGTFGSNPLIQSPFNVSRGAQNSLGSNPLVGNPINAAPPGQINNYTNNPGLFNPASNAGFSNNPAVIASGQPVSGNGLPINGLNAGNTFGLNGLNNANNANNAGFGSSFATYGASLLNSGAGTYFPGGTGPGFGAGYPSFGLAPSSGFSPYGAALSRAGNISRGASRYNLNNARASAAYSAANFYNDLASATASSSYKTSTGIRPSYDIATGSSRLSPAQQRRAADDARAEMIPRDRLIDRNGRILWPDNAPTEPAEVADSRKEVDAAVGAVAAEFTKDGRAPVREVVEAQTKLRDYGSKALGQIKQDKPDDAMNLATFLASLDFSLAGMGYATPSAGPDRTEPENAPKTGGDVLKDSLKAQSKDQAARQPEKTDAAPRTGGDVLKDTVKSERPAAPRP